MDTMITLIAETYAKDADGIDRAKKTRRAVYARMKSATQAEFFSGGRNGLNPDKTFTVFAGDYRGERNLEWNGEPYAVYRTYINGDYVELHTERGTGK